MNPVESHSEPTTPSPTYQLPRARQALLWLLLFGVLYFLAVVLYFAGYGAVLGAQNPELVGSPEFQATVEQRALEHARSPHGITGIVLVQFFIVLPFVLWASHFPTQHLKETLALKSFRLRSLGFWLPVLLGFIVIETLLTAIFDIPAAEFMNSINGSRNWLLAFAIILPAPFLEEMIFRGYLFRAWRHTRLGLGGTLIVTSLIFVSLHWAQYDWIYMTMLFVLSIILGLARERTGSLWVPVILHSVNNLIPAIFVVYLGVL